MANLTKGTPNRPFSIRRRRRVNLLSRIHLFLPHGGPETTDLGLELLLARAERLVFVSELRDLRAKGKYGQAGLDDGVLVVLALMLGDVHVRGAVGEELRLPLKVVRVKNTLIHRRQDIAQCASRAFDRGAKRETSAVGMRGTRMGVEHDIKRVVERA